MIRAYYFPMRRNLWALLERGNRGREKNATLQRSDSPEHLLKVWRKWDAGPPKKFSISTMSPVFSICK